VAKPLEDEALRSRGVAVLEETLGPVQALRFLALLSREPFDYLAWRDKAFGDKTLGDLLSEARAVPRPT